MTQLVTEFYDLNMLYEQVGKEDTSLQRFVEIFLSTIPNDMVNLDIAISNKDYDKVRTSAHKMKSSYMLMGSDWARDICFEIETIIKEDVGKEKLPAIYGELLNKFDKMVALLKS